MLSFEEAIIENLVQTRDCSFKCKTVYPRPFPGTLWKSGDPADTGVCGALLSATVAVGSRQSSERDPDSLHSQKRT